MKVRETMRMTYGCREFRVVKMCMNSGDPRGDPRGILGGSERKKGDPAKTVRKMRGTCGGSIETTYPLYIINKEVKTLADHRDLI